MPKNKDLKRLTRRRMLKTGESYTAARAQLLGKAARPVTAAATNGRAKKPHLPDYAALAGMSDEAVAAKTGCPWARWVRYLDQIGADTMEHRDIARHIAEQFKLSGWWSQTVTVGYERIKGLREIGQRRSGAYEANKSKTFAIDLTKLYRAVSVARTRNRWLPGAKLTIRKSTPNKSVRITWEDGTPVEFQFSEKAKNKCQIQIQHQKLGSRAAAERMKAFWGDRLQVLAEIITPAKGT